MTKKKQKSISDRIVEAMIQFDKAENWQDGYHQGWTDAMEMVHDLLVELEEKLGFEKTVF